MRPSPRCCLGCRICARGSRERRELLAWRRSCLLGVGAAAALRALAAGMPVGTGGRETLRSIASLDRKLERMLAAYRPVQIPEESDRTGPRGGGGGSQAGKPASVDNNQDHNSGSLRRLRTAHAAHGCSRDDNNCSDADSLRESDGGPPAHGYSSGLSAFTVDAAGGSSQGEQAELPGFRVPKVVGKQAESASTAWTDDRHSSYLNSIEDTFVKNMYDSDYVESRSSDGACTSNPAELFEMWQSGCLQSFYRPQALDLRAPPPPAVLHSPWVQHFYRRTPGASSSGGASTSHLDVASGAHDELVEENVLPEDVAPEPKQQQQQQQQPATQPENGVLAWHSRLQQQLSKAPASPPAKDHGAAARKRVWSESADVLIVDTLRSKRQKCQDTLALIDLEMEERFSLGLLRLDVGDHVAGCVDDHQNPAHDQPPVNQVVDPLPALDVPCQERRHSRSVANVKEMSRSRSVQRVLLRSNVCHMSSLPRVDFDQVVPLLRSDNAKDASEPAAVPDISFLQRQGANDGMCEWNGCVDVTVETCDHVSADNKFEASQMVKGSSSAAEGASTGIQQTSAPSHSEVQPDDEPTHHKRRKCQTWNWGLQGLRRSNLHKSGDSAQ